MTVLEITSPLVAAVLGGRGDQVAVDAAGRAVSYDDLAAAVRSVARRLSPWSGEPVAILALRGIDGLVAFLGAVEAGAIAVPLNPTLPLAVLEGIVVQAGARIVLAVDGPVPARPRIGPAEVRSLAELPEAGPPAPARPLAEVTYVLYTSGSSGAAKGVALTGDNAVGFVRWAGSHLGLGPTDRVGWLAPLSSDLMVLEALAALAAGATTVPAPPAATVSAAELAAFLAAARLTVLEAVPSLIPMLLRAPEHRLAEGLATMRAVLFAGEPLPGAALAPLVRAAPHVRWFNVYGMTEANDVLVHEVGADVDESAPVPIGRPIADAEVVLVDGEGQVVEGAGQGELLVASSFVMAGYFNDPERTRRAFAPDPSGRGRRLYRTGDVVRRTDDGTYVYERRDDDQVKVRGHRFSLTEVERVIASHESVSACAAVVVPGALGASHLVAFVTTRQPVAVAELRRHAAALLPRPAVPDHVEVLDAIPLTPVGKADRNGLREGAASIVADRVEDPAVPRR